MQRSDKQSPEEYQYDLYDFLSDPSDKCVSADRAISCHARGCGMSLDGPADTVERACFRCHSGTNQPLTSVSPPLGRPTCVPEAFLTRYGAICPGSQFRTASAALTSAQSQAWLLTATVSSTLATAAMSASICTQRCFLSSRCSGPGRLLIPRTHRDCGQAFGGRMQRNATFGFGHRQAAAR